MSRPCLPRWECWAGCPWGLHHTDCVVTFLLPALSFKIQALLNQKLSFQYMATAEYFLVHAESAWSCHPRFYRQRLKAGMTEILGIVVTSYVQCCCYRAKLDTFFDRFESIYHVDHRLPPVLFVSLIMSPHCSFFSVNTNAES